MKNLLFIIPLLSFSIYCTAGVEVKSLEVSIVGDANEFEIIAKNTIYNNTSSNDTLVWKRVKNEITGAWLSAVCDNQTCWLPETSTSQFVIEPGDSSNLDLYFAPDGNSGKVEVELLVYRLSEGPDNGVTIKYTGSDQVASVNDLLESGEIAIYPNPVTDEITLDSKNSVEGLEIVGMSGAVLITSTSTTLDVSSLTRGSYFLRFQYRGELVSYLFTKE